MKAIIVDDSRAMRTILRGALKEQGFDTVEANDGQHALAQLKEAGKVQLALVDWNMPVMNGYELVCKLRSQKEYDGMAIMMVTTESESSQMQRALGAGANEYVMKPFTPDMLREKLQLLGLGRG